MDTRRVIVPDCGIDFDLLAKQKMALLEEIEFTDGRIGDYESDPGQSDENIEAVREHLELLTGLLHLIDAIQDDAVDNLKLWKFPETED